MIKNIFLFNFFNDEYLLLVAKKLSIKNKIGLMNIGKKNTIKRFFKEMNYYLKTSNRYNIY